MTAPMPSGCEVSWRRREMYLLGDGGRHISGNARW